MAVSEYYIIGSPGDLFEHQVDRDEAVSRARQMVEDGEATNVIVLPVKGSIPFSNPVYHVRFKEGLGIEEPIKARSGRPIERDGTYQRITLEVRSDLLKKIDASGKSRREYIEQLLES
jgi:hypothetical protein